MLLGLPWELWQYIFSFLYQKDLRSLLLVNRILYSLVRGEYYKTMNIGPLSSHSPVSRNTVRAPSHHLSSVAGQITNVFSTFRWGGQRSSNKSHRSPPRIVTNIRSLFGLKEREQEREQSTAETVPALSLVKTLNVDIDSFQGSYFVQRLNFLHLSWPVFADNIHSLSITSNARDFPTLLPKIRLERLESFCTLVKLVSRFLPVVPVDESAALSCSLLPFLATHRENIRNLAFNCDGYSESLMKLMGSFPYFPNLRKLEVDVPTISRAPDSAQGQTSFLVQHRLHLEHLRFKVGTAYSSGNSRRYSQSWQKINFPNLRALSIIKNHEYISRAPDGIDADVLSAALVRHPIHQLSTLEVHSLYLSQMEVSNFIMDLQPSCLRTLSLCIASLSVESFRLLSEELPNLHSLEFMVKSHQPPNSDAEILDSAQRNKGLFVFCKDLQAVDFSEWKLHDLAIIYQFEAFKHMVQIAFLSALPRLRYMNGSRRDESPDWNEQYWDRYVGRLL